MSWIWEHGPSQPTDKLVLLALADNANDEGDCWPSVETIARKTSLSTRSVIRSIKKLKTIGLVMVEKRRENSNKYHLVTNCHYAKCQPVTSLVTESHELSDRESLKPSLNHQLIKEEEEDKSPENVYRAYESEIGALTSKISELIDCALKDYPEGWIVEAIGIAARNNARSWSYIDAILKRWKVEGFNSNNKKSKPHKKNSYQETVDECARKHGIILDDFQILKPEGEIIDV
jgi:DnaD/phage-associated family protein